jgi:3-hydroxyisobutyrate dehydrogenase
MAQTLHKTYTDLVVYNRTPQHADPLRSFGISVADSVSSALKGAECVILMLSDAAAIRQTIISGSLREVLAGKSIIQMGTISPQESMHLLRECGDLGAEYLEAPVLGSVPEATAGKLIVMVGATAGLYGRWKPVLGCFGPEPRLVGTVGAGAALKLAMNQLIAALTAGFGLSLNFTQRHGISSDAFMQIVRSSALYAPTFDKKLSRMLNHDYAGPNFPTKHLYKDISLFADSARSCHLNTASIEGIRAIVQLALDRGMGDQDYSSIFESISSF